MPVPANVKPGQPITAELFNDLLESVRALEASGLGSVAGPIAARRWVIPARITAVLGQDGDVNDDVRYDAVAIGASEASVSAKVPRYGASRAFAGVEINVARVGDLCAIIRVPNDDETYTDDLEVLTEQVLTASCDAGNSGGTGPAPGPGGSGGLTAGPGPGSGGAGRGTGVPGETTGGEAAQ